MLRQLLETELSNAHASGPGCTHEQDDQASMPLGAGHVQFPGTEPSGERKVCFAA